MFNTNWLTKEEIEEIINGPLTEEEITDCRKKHLLVPVFDQIMEGTTKPGQGGTVYFKLRGDDEPYLDCTSQAWVLSLGHAPADVNYAAQLQAAKATHVQYGFLTSSRIKLVNKLAEIAPGAMKGGKVALNNLGGAGAVECAIRTTFINNKKRDQIGVFWRGYHGSTLALAGATQQLDMAMRYRPFGIDRWVKMMFPYCYRCPWNYKNGLCGKKDPECNMECLALVKQNMEYFHTSGMAGVLLEPMQGAGGHIPAPAEFLLGLKGICKENKIKLIYDECQTGFGRTGKMWATEWYNEQLGQDVSPDLLAATKGTAAGYPLGVTIAAPKTKILSEAEEHSTFSSTPVPMAASLVTIEILKRKKIPENAAKQGAKITKYLLELQEKYPQIGDVRCPGLFIGIEMVEDPESRKPNNKLTQAIVDNGMKDHIRFGMGMPIIKPSGEMLRNILKIKPPLIINDEETEKVCQMFEQTLKKSL